MSREAATRVRGRAGRLRVTAITITAYVEAARRARRKAAAALTDEEERLLAQADRLQIRTGVHISTWIQGCLLNALYLTPSRRTAVQVMPASRVFTAALKLLIPFVAAAAVEMTIARATGVPLLPLIALTWGAGLAVIAGIFAAILRPLLRYERWAKSLPRAKDEDEPEPSRSLGAARWLPHWEISSLASTKDPRLVAGLVSAINAIVPAGRRITAKARDRDLFNVYKLYLVPVGGDDNLALKPRSEEVL